MYMKPQIEAIKSAEDVLSRALKQSPIAVDDHDWNILVTALSKVVEARLILERGTE